MKEIILPQYPDEYTTTGRRRHLYKRGWYGRQGLRKKVVRYLNNLQNGKCAMCKKDGFGKLELDHIKKFSEGGEHKLENFQLLCTECHDLKDNEKTHKREDIPRSLD